jgi:hypothetical protein
MCRLIGLAVFTFCLTAILVPVQLAARDDGRFANSLLKPWFNRLASGKGLCCSFADGFSVAQVDFTDALDSSKMTLILTARTKANVAAGLSIPLLRCAALRQTDCSFLERCCKMACVFK